MAVNGLMNTIFPNERDTAEVDTDDMTVRVASLAFEEHLQLRDLRAR